MKKKIFLKIVLILSLIIITWFVYSEYFKKNESLLSKTVNPTTEIEGVITSYDYVTRTITVDPPLDVGTNAFSAMIIPPRESRQIRRYAHFNGLLTESVARGSRTIVFPRVRSGPAFVGTASAESGYYNGLYIVLRPTQTTGMPGEIRTIISYDGPSRTATLDRPLNLQYTVFDATFSAAPEPCEGDYVVGSNEFEVYFQPGPRNPPYYVVSDADVGRLALSYQDSAGNGAPFLPDLTFRRLHQEHQELILHVPSFSPMVLPPFSILGWVAQTQSFNWA